MIVNMGTQTYYEKGKEKGKVKPKDKTYTI